MTSTRREEVGVRLRWTHADGEMVGVSSMWTSTQKIFKLEPTYVILSSFHAKKFACFGPEFCHWME